MTSGRVTVGEGPHESRCCSVLLVGKHSGLLESGVEMLAHEGYQALGIRFESDPRVALADAIAGLPAGSKVDVLVLGGAVPGDVRPDMAADIRVHSPTVKIVEHRGSLVTLFEEVLAALRAEPH